MSEPLVTPAPNLSRPWKLVFFGGAHLSLPSLRALTQGPDEVALVVAPPPAPFGRGRQLKPSPVAEAAAELGLKVWEGKSVKSPEAIETIASVQPDLLVVVAFSGFLPQELLQMCPHPPINLHPSLLPRHRGPAPINWSLIQGDGQVGVSIIFLEKKMDAGAILSQRGFSATPPDSAGLWEQRLAEVGAKDLLKVISDLKHGTIEPREQDEALASVNPLLRKEDGWVDFTRPAPQLANLINGVDPWPGAHTKYQGKNLKLFGAVVMPEVHGEPGQVLGLTDQGWLLVATGHQGGLALAELQPEGKKRLTAGDFIRGYRPKALGDLQ